MYYHIISPCILQQTSLALSGWFITYRVILFHSGPFLLWYRGSSDLFWDTSIQNWCEFLPIFSLTPSPPATISHLSHRHKKKWQSKICWVDRRRQASLPFRKIPANLCKHSLLKALWSEHSNFLPKSTLWKAEVRESNFTARKNHDSSARWSRSTSKGQVRLIMCIGNNVMKTAPSLVAFLPKPITSF